MNVQNPSVAAFLIDLMYIMLCFSLYITREFEKPHDSIITNTQILMSNITRQLSYVLVSQMTHEILTV